MRADEWSRARPIIAAGLILIAVLVLLLMAIQVRQLLAVLFLGIVLGVTLNPFVDAMARYRLPRVVAILLVYLLVTAMLALVAAYAIFEVSQQDFSGNIDEIRQDYESLREGTSLPSSDEVEQGLKDVSKSALGGLAGQALTVVSALGGVATILFTALLFSTTQERMRQVVLSFVHPDRRDRGERLLQKYAAGLRGFARGELMAMTTIGIVTFLGLSLIGVPLAVPLAFFAFAMELLPMIGPWIALIPALVVGFTQGTWTGVEVLILYLGIQAFESYALTPLVHSRESQVPSLMIFIAILIGGGLMGVLGALVALPIGVLVHITYFEVVQPWNERRHGESGVATAGESR